MESTVDPVRYAAAAARFTAFFNELGLAYIEREDVLAQIALGLLAREHVLMTGPPGTAKSQIASAVLGRIVDERTGRPSMYSRQFTESTVQTDLIGPINFKTLMDSGRTEHFTDEGMLGSVHAFLDEVFDGRDMLLRSALNVLNERELKEGSRTTRGQIECAVMTSNRYLAEVLEGSRESLLAFVDRVAFVNFVPKGFATPSNLALVLRRMAGGTGAPRLEAQLTVQDLDVLQAVTESVEIHDGICDSLVKLLAAIEEEMAAAARSDPEFVPTRYLSVRSAVRAGRTLRAICVYDKLFRDADRVLAVQHGDLFGLRLQLLLAGPTPEAVTALISRETDPRERRQLGIIRTEREIFDRCFRQLPVVEPPAPPTAVDVAHLETSLHAAFQAGTTEKIVEAAADLARVAASPGPSGARGKKLLHDATGAMAERALRAGLTAGVAVDATLEASIQNLAAMADALEKTAPPARSLARWLRGRAITILEESLSLLPTSKHEVIETIAGTSQADVKRLGALAEWELAELESLAALRERLRAAGADLADSEAGVLRWRQGVARVEADAVALWGEALRATAASTPKSEESDNIATAVTRLKPILSRIDAFARRVTALTQEPSRLKARVVAPRLGQLVQSAFERMQMSDRASVGDQLEELLNDLARVDLSSVLEPSDVISWAATALLRSEPPPHVSTPPASYSGYRKLREEESRVPLAYALAQIGGRLIPRSGHAPEAPMDAAAALAKLIATIPLETRDALVTADLARVERAVVYLEQWWEAVAGNAETGDPVRLLDAIRSSRILHVIHKDATLRRFSLEAGLVAEVMPSHAANAEKLRSRVEVLDARVNDHVAVLLQRKLDASWSQQ